MMYKLLHKIFNFPSKIKRIIENKIKKSQITSIGDVYLLEDSIISNHQNNNKKIVIGSNTRIRGELSVFPNGGNITIGKDCYVGSSTRIWSMKSIIIGDRVQISHNVNIHDNNSHSISALMRHRHLMDIYRLGHPNALEDVRMADIIIEDDVWIGFNSIIFKGVRIGAGSIIQAGSIVNTDVEPYSIFAGNLAQKIAESKK